jgi:hypothetical protein
MESRPDKDDWRYTGAVLESKMENPANGVHRHE